MQLGYYKLIQDTQLEYGGGGAVHCTKALDKPGAGWVQWRSLKADRDKRFQSTARHLVQFKMSRGTASRENIKNEGF